MRKLAPILVVMALTATRLEAQYDRRYEVGLFGAFTKYDQAFGLSDKIGGGVRFSYAVTPMFGLEVEALFQSPQDISATTQIEPMIGAASLIVNTINASRMTVYVLGGYSRLDFGGTSPYHFTDGGVHGGAGAKFYMSSRVALRFEARGVYTPQTNSTFGTKATHLIGSAGFSFFQSDGAPAGDADHDRVSDKKDACPDTPPGVKVDAKGCPFVAAAPPPAPPPTVELAPTAPPPPPPGALPDSDGDGVNDLLDKCPETPAGVTVNAEGCPIDSDRDGVWDGVDKCPETPVGATVDANGCPSDSDGDKVFDGMDRCPDTPSGTPVDSFGCPADSDKDGVGDGIDKCPDTPAGIQVDATGCPLAHDTDGDGVIDPQDRCPNTPAGSRVDQFGCLLLFEERPVTPAPPGAPPARPTLILQGVNFQTGRSVLTASSYAVLDQVAASLVANPEIRIEIAGYTDSTGSKLMNMRLSMGRAGAVQHYLARKGVSPLRMRARGFGASGYIAPNTTPDGRAQNRRVELHKLN